MVYHNESEKANCDKVKRNWTGQDLFFMGQEIISK